MAEAAQMATAPTLPMRAPRGSADAQAGGDGATEWQGPFRRRGIPRPFSWATILWNMILPHRGARNLPTTAGMLLLALAVAIAVAAYNTASIILFITLSLLLSCPLLHGLLDLLNFRRVSWRLIVKPPLRAGEESMAAIEVRNDKRVLPTHAIWFQTAAPRSGLEGLLPLPGRLGGWWRWLGVLRFVPRAVRDGVYRWIARHRYRWFGQRESCRVPSETERARFLP
jgi:hypothetical protein